VEALRTALLRELANASTAAEIESLKAQVHDADASIASDQAAVNRLNAGGTPPATRARARHGLALGHEEAHYDHARHAPRSA
jgi:hypothetical protein